jgi:hypothetical protein
MQRLDESPDFRPFKFRIAAFTHGFLEEVVRSFVRFGDRLTFCPRRSLLAKATRRTKYR